MIPNNRKSIAILPIVLIQLFCLFSQRTNAQHQIAETDTSLHYLSTFYNDGNLVLDGRYVYVHDTMNAPGMLVYENAENYDSTRMQKLEEGKFIRNRADKKRKGYYLVEYHLGDLVGKRYDFDRKGNLISTYGRYPKLKDSVFNGGQVIRYDKKQRISSIEYILFAEDQTNEYYWNYIAYNEDGNLVYYVYDNELADIRTTKKWNAKGELIYDHLHTPTEYHDMTWSKNRKKLKVRVKENGEWVTKYYKNDQLVKEKKGY